MQNVTQSAAALLFVLALIFGVYAVLKKFTEKPPAPPPPKKDPPPVPVGKVLHRQDLDESRHVLLLEYGDVRYVILSANNQLLLLDRVSKQQGAHLLLGEKDYKPPS